MAKLFAMEEEDLGTEVVEMEVEPEVGEAADVQAEVAEDTQAIDEIAESTEEGMDAADQLEEVQEVVADAAENGEGLDEVAAEAIRISIAAIAARVGANPKSVYSLYATENFQSASSRKANTKLALEGITEFLQDLWKRIKAALDKLWVKMKDFWNKHLSNIGRLRAAAESLKKKVSKVSEKGQKSAFVEKAPSSLRSAFPGKGDIDAAAVLDVVKAASQSKDGAAVVKDITDTLDGIAAKPGEDAKATLAGKFVEFKTVGGETVKYEVTTEDDQVTVTRTVEPSEAESSDDRGVNVASKEQMNAILNEVLTSVKNMQDIQKKSDEAEKAKTNGLNAIQKAIVNTQATDEEKATMRKNMKTFNRLNVKYAQYLADKQKASIKSAYAGLNFVGFCLRQYKA